MAWHKLVSRGLIAPVAFFLIASSVEAKKVRLAIPSESMSMLLFATARDRGYYQEEGLEVEFILMRDAVANVALIGGNVEFSALGAGPIPAILRGAPLRFLFTSWVKPFFSLHARAAISEVKDLKGKRVGVSGFGAGPELLVRELLRRNGLSGDRDVVIIVIGSSTDSVNALVTGSVDAALLAIPFNIKAEEMGFRAFVSFMKEDWALQLQGGIAVREDLLQNDPGSAEKFVRGTYKGLLYARDNRSGTIGIAARFLKIGGELAAKLYDQTRPTMTTDGTVNESLQKRVLDDVIKLQGQGTLPPLEKVFDYSLARKIRAELEQKGWKPGP